MPTSLNIHEPELVNTLGHSAGVLLFGYLFWLLLRDLRGRRVETPVLPAVAALLALIWNAGSLFALGSRGSGGDAPAAISFASLSVLPAVLLSISLRSAGRALLVAGWTISGIAVCLHVAEVFVANAALHQWGLILIAVGFTALAALSVVHSGRQGVSRVLVPIALLFFAASFVHFAEPADRHLWSRELALHHAGIPLALFIVLQDYRFLMADVFVRGLGASLVAAGLTVLTVFAVERWNLVQAAAASPFAAGLLIAAACAGIIVFSALTSRLDRALSRYVFRRRGARDVIRELTEAPLAASERLLLDEAARVVARFVRAERFELHSELPPDVYLPRPAHQESAPWAEVALPVRFVRGEGVLLLLGRREGGRRYLSGDFEDLARLAAAISARVERFRDQERERLTARAELRALQAQINPHFLFNSLNALYGSIPRSAADARRTVLNLSEIFRYFLQNDRAVIPVADEIRIVRAYLEIEQLRLGDRLRTEIEVDAAAESECVPALTIEPLVENAVKHGVAPHTVPGMVRVSVRRVEEGIDVRVEDSGPGFQSSGSGDGAGVGLDNVRQRLLMTYGPGSELQIETTDAGTSVSFRVPVGGDRWSGCRDLNPGPLAPQASALARLRHSPRTP